MARTRSRSVESNNGNGSVEVSDRRRRARGIETQNEARPERQAPTGRSVRPRGAGTGLVSRIPVVSGVVAYFRGVASEMRKVTWPTREETIRLTIVVLAVTAAFSIGLGVLDTFFGWWFSQAFHADSEIIFLAVGAVLVVAVSGAFLAVRNRI